MPRSKNAQEQPQDVDMFDDDPFSDFDIENEGASSTPVVTKSKGAAKTQTKAASAEKSAKSTTKTAASASKTTPKAAAGANKTTAKKGKGKGKAAQASGKDDGNNEDAHDASRQQEQQQQQQQANTMVEDEAEERATIPPLLLTRIIHGFFEQDNTRMTKAANDAVARYVEVFTREAVARAAAGKRGGFLEVEDLEKVGPQLLLDM